MHPATMSGSPRVVPRAIPSVSGARSAGARSARRLLGGRRTVGVASGVALDSRSAASGGCGTAGREPPAS